MRQSKKQKQLREFIEQSKPTVNAPEQAQELENKILGNVNKIDELKKRGE